MSCLQALQVTDHTWDISTNCTVCIWTLLGMGTVHTFRSILPCRRYSALYIVKINHFWSFSNNYIVLHY